VNIQELKSKVETYAADCYDVVAPSSDIGFASNGGYGHITVAQDGELFGETADVQANLNQHAFTQLAERLDAPPVRWLADDEHCDPELRDVVLNYLLQERENTFLLRQKGECCRAVLSDQYTKFDNPEFVDLVGEALETAGTEAVVARVENHDVLRAYVVLPQITFAPDPGVRQPGLAVAETGPQWAGNVAGHRWLNNGGLHPAIYISNSEIGTGAARVAGGIFRAICENGVIIGWKAEHAQVVVHRHFTRGIIRSIIASAVADGLKMSEEAAKRFVQSQEVHIEKKSLRPLVDDWAAKYGISVEAKDNWLGAVMGEATSYGRADEPTLFDLVNAATYTAHALGSDEREMVERMAGDLLLSRQRVFQEE
jgi:hypothetical protein